MGDQIFGQLVEIALNDADGAAQEAKNAAGRVAGLHKVKQAADGVVAARGLATGQHQTDLGA